MFFFFYYLFIFCITLLQGTIGLHRNNIDSSLRLRLLVTFANQKSFRLSSDYLPVILLFL